MSISLKQQKRRVRKDRSEDASRVRQGKHRQWRIFALLVAICAGVAIVGSMLLNANYEMIANIYFFGESKPHISPERERELKKEFDAMIMREFRGAQ